MTPKQKYNYSAVWMIQQYYSAGDAWYVTGGQYWFTRTKAREEMAALPKMKFTRYRLVKYVPEGAVKP